MRKFPLIAVLLALFIFTGSIIQAADELTISSSDTIDIKSAIKIFQWFNSNAKDSVSKEQPAKTIKISTEKLTISLTKWKEGYLLISVDPKVGYFYEFFLNEKTGHFETRYNVSDKVIKSAIRRILKEI